MSADPDCPLLLVKFADAGLTAASIKAGLATAKLSEMLEDFFCPLYCFILLLYTNLGERQHKVSHRMVLPPRKKILDNFVKPWITFCDAFSIRGADK